MEKLFIINATEKSSNNFIVYVLMTKKGEILHNHSCSNLSYAIGDLEANIDKERQEQLKERFGEYKVLFDCSPYTSQGTIDTLNKKFGRDKYGFIQESDNKELLNEFAKLWFLKGEIERVNNRIHKLTPNQ